MIYFDKALEFISEHEGKIPWIYLDTRGNVTVGVGLMLPNINAALAQPFKIKGMGGDLPATHEQVENDWNRIQSMPIGLAAHAYECMSSVFLEDLDIQANLSNYVKTEEAAIRAGLAGYDSFPDDAKIALLDMGYNLGSAGLLHGYPHLCAACVAKNWKLASQECQRGGIGTTRNSWTVSQFLASAE